MVNTGGGTSDTQAAGTQAAATANVATNPAYQKLEGDGFDSAISNMTKGEIVQLFKDCPWIGLYRNRSTGVLAIGLVGNPPGQTAQH